MDNVVVGGKTTQHALLFVFLLIDGLLGVGFVILLLLTDLLGLLAFGLLVKCSQASLLPLDLTLDGLELSCEL